MVLLDSRNSRSSLFLHYNIWHFSSELPVRSSLHRPHMTWPSLQNSLPHFSFCTQLIIHTLPSSFLSIRYIGLSSRIKCLIFNFALFIFIFILKHFVTLCTCFISYVVGLCNTNSWSLFSIKWCRIDIFHLVCQERNKWFACRGCSKRMFLLNIFKK